MPQRPNLVTSIEGMLQADIEALQNINITLPESLHHMIVIRRLLDFTWNHDSTKLLLNQLLKNCTVL